MVDFGALNDYIMENVMHNEAWTELDDDTKMRALNNAVNTLVEYLPSIYTSNIPLFDASEQVLFVVRKDDNMSKAELGLKSMAIDGISMTYGEVLPIASAILTKYGVTKDNLHTFKRRRVGSYRLSIADTSRWCD